VHIQGSGCLHGPLDIGCGVECKRQSQGLDLMACLDQGLAEISDVIICAAL
jgi:hypothetical protein